MTQGRHGCPHARRIRGHDEAKNTNRSFIVASPPRTGLSRVSTLRTRRRPMLHVSIFVEGLRSQPRLMFWLAALAQAAIWWLVPAIFYAAPPGDLPRGAAGGPAL